MFGGASKPIELLLVEDSASDVRLTQKALKESEWPSIPVDMDDLGGGFILAIHRQYLGGVRVGPGLNFSFHLAGMREKAVHERIA
jgi:hypothetical protein